MVKRSTWSLPYVIFLVVFVVLPLLLIVLYAFQDGSGHFTLANIGRFFADICIINRGSNRKHLDLHFVRISSSFDPRESEPEQERCYGDALHNAHVDQRPHAYAGNCGALQRARNHPWQRHPSLRYGL